MQQTWSVTMANVSSDCLFWLLFVFLHAVSTSSETPGVGHDLNNALDVPQATEMSNAKYVEYYVKMSQNITIENATMDSKIDADDYLSAFPDPLDCGKSNKSTNRVVGGEPAKLGEFPWMALLGYNTRYGRHWDCGGSLISVRHVLTVAHCIYNREHMLKVVRLGELDYNREDEGAHPIDFQIKTMIPHEHYDPNTSSNDIGLLILKGDVTFTTVLHPICFPKGKWKNETFEGALAYIAGWGRISYRGTPASHLQAALLPIRKNADCVDAFRAYNGRVIDQRVMCVGYIDGDVDSCGGDSGGPLMISLTSSNGTYFALSGIISYGFRCGYYGIYTRVSYFLPWIEEKVLGRVTGLR